MYPRGFSSTSWEPGKHTSILPSLRPIEWKEITSLLNVRYMLLHISQSEAFVCPMRANSTSWEAYKDLSFFATY